MSDTELLPCPFCGSPADDFNPDGEQEGYHVGCSGKTVLFHADGNCCPMNSFSFTKYEDAVRAWNSRVAFAAQLSAPVQPSDQSVQEIIKADTAIIERQNKRISDLEIECATLRHGLRLAERRYQEAIAAPVAAQEPDAYIVRTVERAIKEATQPQGMGLYDGMARIPASILARLLKLAVPHGVGQ